MFNQLESVIVTRNLDVCLPSEAETPTIDPTAQCTISESIGKITSAAKILHPRLSLTVDYLYHFQGPMVYIFMSQFVSGIGTTLFSILGVTYLDDNAKRKQTPMLIGIQSLIR